MTADVLAARRFTAADQRRFAEISGDRNPMHVDATAARRTQAGDMVVHGIHAVLWALEVLAAELGSGPGSIRAQFLKFIYVDEPVDLILKTRDGSTVEVDLVSGGLTTTRLSICFDQPRVQAQTSYADVRETVYGVEPLVPALESISGSGGWISSGSHGDAISELFPLLCARVGDQRVLALALTSTLVGMVCPGLHSIYSSLSVTIVDDHDTRPGIGWEAIQKDVRYPRINLTVAGTGISAQITAFVRPAPVDPAPIASLAAAVASGEFSGRRALIIGGSRGLGATTAKLLAAGGAEVALTYVRGRTEAEAVCDDILSLRGGDAAVALPCDIEQPFTPTFVHRLGWATHIYYFPTSLIGRQTASAFTPDRYSAFNRVFVECFHAVVHSACGGRPLNVFYPSTIYVEERPKGMTEYAMAKAAGEILCSDLVRSTPGLSISFPRLPRVLTDQTASAIPIQTADAADVMLPLLRNERAI